MVTSLVTEGVVSTDGPAPTNRAVGATLDEIAARTGRKAAYLRRVLRRVLAEEVEVGNVTLAGGRYSLAPDGLDPAVVAALSAVTPLNVGPLDRAGREATPEGDSGAWEATPS